MAELIHILLIEDNVDDYRLVHDNLTRLWSSSQPFSLVHERSLAQGLQRLSAQAFHIILLDMNLPDARGLEAFLQVKKGAPSVPIVVLNELADEDLALEAMRNGAYDYLNKKHAGGPFLGRIVRYAIERHKSEEALFRLASFPELNPNPILEARPSGEMTYANPVARKLFPNLPAVGFDHPLLHGLDVVYVSLKDTHQVLTHREVEIGSAIYEEQITLVPQEDALRIYVRDITERKNIENLKDAFISTLSHELRTPLTIIKTAMTNLEDRVAGELNDKQKRIISIANNNVDRLTRLINDLLDLSRLESGKTAIHRQAVDIRPLVQDVIQSFQIPFKERNLELHDEWPASLPQLYADPDLMTQVLTNLLANAGRYASKVVRIQAHVFDGILSEDSSLGEKPLLGAPQDQYVEISVLDDGPGIPEDQMGHLFNKFVQINRPAGGSGYKGTGLGLAICREIVHRHQGVIKVENQEGSGAQFSFSIPVYDEAKDFMNQFQIAMAEAEEKGKSIALMILTLENLVDLKKELTAAEVESLFDKLQLKILREALRRNDKLFHYSVKDFIAVIAETGEQGAGAIQNRIHDIASRLVHSGKNGPISPKVSIGCALYPSEAPNKEELLMKALKRVSSPVSP